MGHDFEKVFKLGFFSRIWIDSSILLSATSRFLLMISTKKDTLISLSLSSVCLSNTCSPSPVPNLLILASDKCSLNRSLMGREVRFILSSSGGILNIVFDPNIKNSWHVNDHLYHLHIFWQKGKKCMDGMSAHGIDMVMTKKSNLEVVLPEKWTCLVSPASHFSRFSPTYQMSRIFQQMPSRACVRHARLIHSRSYTGNYVNPAGVTRLPFCEE